MPPLQSFDSRPHPVPTDSPGGSRRGIVRQNRPALSSKPGNQSGFRGNLPALYQLSDFRRSIWMDTWSGTACVQSCAMVTEETAMSKSVTQAFLLTRSQRQTPSGLEFTFWASSPSGPAKVVVTDQEAVCFIPRDQNSPAAKRSQVELRSLDGHSVDALYFADLKKFRSFREDAKRQDLLLFESDVAPVDRFLMERFLSGPLEIHGDPVQKMGCVEFMNPVLRPMQFSPVLSVACLDIETEGLDGKLYSIALATPDSERVFMVGSHADCEGLSFHPDEKSLLQAFLAHIQNVDPDLIVGWNVVEFDLDFLARRCQNLGIPFRLGRNLESCRILPARASRQSKLAQVPGRIVLDGISGLKTAMYSFENFSLDSVSRELLGKGKLISPGHRVEEITRLYHEAPTELAAYNLQDCRLVLDIFDKANLINLLVERSRLTGLSLDRQGGSVAAFDFVYLPLLHRRGFVAPDLADAADAESSPGGHVMDSKPGLYENVLVLDFKSLYPSIIRTFHVDPLALAQPGENPIAGYHGARFSRDESILPQIITGLWAERDKAKKQGNKPLSQAIKILMNSFYGVLGTPGCRFFNPRLAGSITYFGKRIITATREYIEQQGHQVIYGDTDSVFVLLGPGHSHEAARNIGKNLEASLNQWWRSHLRETLDLESYLEIQFETHFLKFLMPTIRGSQEGSKKRYAGLVRRQDNDFDVVFKGLESVRSDWTPLAREFQRTLYRKVFLGEPYEDHIRQVVADLFAGRLDGLLVYRKQLRKPVGEYQKNIPPQVQAARKLDKPGRWISYVITLNGPEPAEHQPSRLDYHHYLERQLAPAADGLLHFLGTSVKALTDTQMQLF